MHFLFPSNPIRSTEPDEVFVDQIKTLSEVGFSVSLCPDNVIQNGKPLRNLPAGATIIYRGWMLNGQEYQRLVDAITHAGATALTSPTDYLAAHHLPNWYPRVSQFTPETKVFKTDDDFESRLRELKWDAFFVKDYVKSLKTSAGSIIRDPSQIAAMVVEMKKFRGDLEGGLCVRRVEDFLPDTERRYFAIKGRPFSPTLDSVPDLVTDVATRMNLPFISIDVIQRSDGALRLVEIGDGQVSDLVGWTPEAFAKMWSTLRD